VRADYAAPVFLFRRVLGLGVRVVHRIRQPDRLALPDSIAEPRQLLRGEEPLPALLWVLLDVAGRVHPVRHKVALRCKGVEAPHHGQHPIGLIRMFAELPMKLRNVRDRDLSGLSRPEFRQH
jgi:hypothetical protein